MTDATMTDIAPERRGPPARIVLQKLGYALFAMFIFAGSMAFVEPSPYEIIAPLTIVVWLLLGLKFSVHLVWPVFVLLLFTIGGFISLIPFFDDFPSVLFIVQSAYLTITAIFFMMFFYNRTNERIELAFKAYVASCLFTGGLGIIGWFDIGGTHDVLARWGRASGTFEDPNVFGSFLTPGALFLMQKLLLGTTRHRIVTLAMLGVILTGIFLSFSRGSWGGTIIATTMLVGFTFITAPSIKVRMRILMTGFVTVALAVVLISAALSVPEVSDIFQKRASVTQDYDEGETGRFGNQRRSIPMLIEEPLGFGPLRFRFYFDYDPHSSYVNAFASYGWLGGFSFIALVASTIFVGFRMCLTPSPVQRQAQFVFPAMFMFFLQAFQIDIDHWRHVFLLIGAVWGLEAARRYWVATGRMP